MEKHTHKNEIYSEEFLTTALRVAVPPVLFIDRELCGSTPRAGSSFLRFFSFDFVSNGRDKVAMAATGRVVTCSTHLHNLQNLHHSEMI